MRYTARLTPFVGPGLKDGETIKFFSSDATVQS